MGEQSAFSNREIDGAGNRTVNFPSPPVRFVTLETSFLRCDSTEPVRGASLFESRSDLADFDGLFCLIRHDSDCPFTPYI
jgi:hypothetical protein